MSLRSPWSDLQKTLVSVIKSGALVLLRCRRKFEASPEPIAWRLLLLCREIDREHIICSTFTTSSMQKKKVSQYLWSVYLFLALLCFTRHRHGFDEAQKLTVYVVYFAMYRFLRESCHCCLDSNVCPHCPSGKCPWLRFLRLGSSVKAPLKHSRLVICRRATFSRPSNSIWLANSRSPVSKWKQPVKSWEYWNAYKRACSSEEQVRMGLMSLAILCGFRVFLHKFI